MLREIIEIIPDARLLHLLRQARANGRNEYPVHVSWGVVLLAVLLRHVSIAACLSELRRNTELRRLIGAETAADVPKEHNMSRFLKTLGQDPFRAELRHIGNAMVKLLGAAVPDLGRRTAGDATALRARSGAAVEGLPQPTGGRKEYVDDKGYVTKAFEWFGYKLHLLVDVRHEVALAWQVTDATTTDGHTLPALLKEGLANLPEGRIETLAYDKAADDGDIHRLLDQNRIRPLIQIRNLWRQESERMFPGATGCSNVVYDKAGSVFCYDKVSDLPVRHPPHGLHRARGCAQDA